MGRTFKDYLLNDMKKRAAKAARFFRLIVGVGVSVSAVKRYVTTCGVNISHFLRFVNRFYRFIQLPYGR